MTVADVYINIPIKSIRQEFTYRLPEDLAQVTAGWRVFVPFGNVRKEGFVTCVRPYDAARDGKHTLRDIVAAVDEEAWFSPELLAAAQELCASPSNTVVLEDSPNGIRAAHAGGFIPIMVPDVLQPDDAIRACCHMVCEDLYEAQEAMSDL